MFTRQHRKRQFHVDLAQPPQGRVPLSQTAGTRPHRKRQFYVDLPELSRPEPPDPPQQRVRRLPSITQAIKRVHFPHRSSAIMTLAQRRLLQRLSLILMFVGVVLAAALGGGLYFASHAQAPSPVSSSLGVAESPNTHRGQLQHTLLNSPFSSLEQHVAANGLQPPTVRAASAFVFDPNRGWVFYAKHADDVRSIASLTKVMTLLIASEASDLDQPVTIRPDAAALVNSANSYMGVSAGEQLTIRDLLYGLVVASGNDAAVALADAISGSQASFVALMNRYALQLGLTHTHFVSPDGLDDGNHSTARDLAMLAAIALVRPEVQQISATRHYTISPTATHRRYNLWNNNDLLPGGHSPYPGANGVKTGYTDSARYCQVFSAHRDGHLIVGVVLGDPSAEARTNDARALLDWGFAQE